MKRLTTLLALCLFALPVFAQKLLIPMDLSQTDHLKAYGIAYDALEKGIKVEWLLNYRGGSFMMDQSDEIANECRLRGVKAEDAGGAGELLFTMLYNPWRAITQLVGTLIILAVVDWRISINPSILEDLLNPVGGERRHFAGNHRRCAR